MLLRHWHYLLRRKCCQMNPLFAVFIILVLLLYYEGYLSWNAASAEQSKLSSQFTQQSKFIRKINLLTSVLKQHKVPEDLYIEENLPVIYVITPTHRRPVQKAELTRLKNVFLHIPAFHWIVIEDAEEKSTLVENFLSSSGLTFTHLNIATPPQWKSKSEDPRWWKPRGVLQRNEGITWLRRNLKPSSKGVVYFADDDNTYSIELFHQMRNTKKVSVWPVALVGGVMVERPSVDEQGKVNGWIVGWRPDRAFATDMAGFAVNLQLLRSSNAYFSLKSLRGFMESDFLQLLLKGGLADLEPKANGATQVFVWHTQTTNPKLKDEYKLNGNRGISHMEIEV